MTALQFLDLVRRSQLLDDETLRSFLTMPSDGDELAAAMVKAGLLTTWQAEKLLAGKFKGFMLGDYTLLRHLRKHVMCQQYVAEHTVMKRKVVLWVAPSNRVEDSTYLERFRTEAGGGELHQDGGTHYIVRAFIEGQDEGE